MAFDEISTPDDLIGMIKRKLTEMAVDNDLSITNGSCGEILRQLLKGLSKKHGVGAVILVDEYDAPVTDHISDRNLALACRNVLHDFYRSIKTNLIFIRFTFVTGITRFAMTAVDSGANNFIDISLDEKFAGICGFTLHEFNVLFEDRFEATLTKLKANGQLPPGADVGDLKDKILEWYDGYNWLGKENVLNPYSIIRFFYKNQLGSYWPLPGKPSLLSSLFRDKILDFREPGFSVYPEKQITQTDIYGIGPVPVLFHSGYLTIDKVIDIPVLVNNISALERAYTFTIPNTEVGIDLKSVIFNDIFKLEQKICKRFIGQSSERPVAKEL
jgi:hypothetical protein